MTDVQRGEVTQRELKQSWTCPICISSYDNLRIWKRILIILQLTKTMKAAPRLETRALKRNGMSSWVWYYGSMWGMMKKGSGISCASTSSSSVVNHGRVSLWCFERLRWVWLVARNSPLSWHTGPIYDPLTMRRGQALPRAAENTTLKSPAAALQKEIPTYISPETKITSSTFSLSSGADAACLRSLPEMRGMLTSFTSVTRRGETLSTERQLPELWARGFHGRQPAGPQK